MIHRLVLIGICCGCLSLGASSAAEAYLARLQSELARLRRAVPNWVASAEQAADGFLAGGPMLAGGRQPDFVGEACGRAGGLMSIQPLGAQPPAARTVLLYAVPGPLTETDQRVLRTWREQGAVVMTFSSPAGLFQESVPLDTVLNVAQLWAWTGEFVAACTRRGKMPTLYRSYGLPGGPERGKKYQGKSWHEDMSVPAIPARRLGTGYLKWLEASLSTWRKDGRKNIRQAAAWWGESGVQESIVFYTGHMFPRHAQDPRVATPARLVAAPAWEDRDLLDPFPAARFSLYLGYQRAPTQLVNSARRRGVALCYTTVQAVEPAGSMEKVEYLKPGWPMDDGCVTVPGYDIPILPSSGVLQAALYWALLAERPSPSATLKP